jgi:hypothetical protein
MLVSMLEKVAKAIWDYHECGDAGLQWDKPEPGTMSDLQKRISIDCAKKCLDTIKQFNYENGDRATLEAINEND